MKALTGTKIGMGSLLDDKGAFVAATFIKSSNPTVAKIKTVETDGYNAYVVTSGANKRELKSILGQFKETHDKTPGHVQEFRFEGEPTLKIGDELNVAQFEAGDKIIVTAKSKGKGYTGTIKRWNFGRGPESHGGRGSVRLPGSIGSMYPQKVFKGKKMSGQYGAKRSTVKNLEVVMIDAEKGLLAVKGSIPGSNNQMVTVKGIA